MGTISLSLNSRSSTSIDVNAVWKPDSSHYYRVTVWKGSQGKYFQTGLIGNGDTANYTASWTGLTSNTQYTFEATVDYRDSTSSDWQAGSATDTKSFITYPATPSSINASVNGSTLSVSWSQNTGGGASTVKNLVHIYNSNGGLVIQGGASTSRSYSTSVSGWAAGTYTVEIFAINEASDDDDATISNTTTFTISSESVTPTGTWTVSPTVTTLLSPPRIRYSYTWKSTTSTKLKWNIKILIDGEDFDESGPVSLAYGETYSENNTDAFVTDAQSTSGNHTVTFIVYADTNDNNIYSSDEEVTRISRIITFTDPSGPTTGSITGSHSSVTTSSAQISASASLNVGSYPYYYYIAFRVYDSQGTSVYSDQTGTQTINSGSSNPYTGSGSRTVSGLSSSTPYQYQVILYGGTTQNSLTQLDYDEGNFTTSSSGGGGGGGEDEYPTVTTRVTSVTGSTATISATINPVEAGWYGVNIWCYTNDSQHELQVIVDSDIQYSWGSSVAVSALEYDLEPETDYYYYAYLVKYTSPNDSSSGQYIDDGVGGRVRSRGTFTTTESSASPLLLWSWETASGSWNAENQPGHSSLATAAKDALQNKTATTNFSHLIWNDIIDWLADNLNLLSVSYDSSTASSAKMTAQPYYLTAEKWNDMVDLWNTLEDAIESGGGYTMYDKSAGDPVNAALFIGQNGFITIMNNSIDNYNT